MKWGGRRFPTGSKAKYWGGRTPPTKNMTLVCSSYSCFLCSVFFLSVVSLACCPWSLGTIVCSSCSRYSSLFVVFSVLFSFWPLSACLVTPGHLALECWANKDPVQIRARAYQNVVDSLLGDPICPACRDNSVLWCTEIYLCLEKAS
jgi:hypothetical protein